MLSMTEMMSSIFFDDVSGRAYVVHNGPPPDKKPLYAGHRAQWLHEFDPEAGEFDLVAVSAGTITIS